MSLIIRVEVKRSVKELILTHFIEEGTLSTFDRHDLKKKMEQV